MFCLIAAEKETAQKIKVNLERSGFYPGWEFAVCEDAQELQKWSRENVDVLVLSRFLPGSGQSELLRNLKMMFPAAHIVLLAGNPSEGRRTYIRTAHKYGLNNIVTGKLPGDRPYTIFVALKSSKEPEKDGYYTLEEETENREAVEENGMPEAEKEDGSYEEKRQKKDVKAALEELIEESEDAKETEIIRGKLQEIIKMLDSGSSALDSCDGTGPMLTRGSMTQQKGILVLSAANKGGVGKTTVAVTLAVALSRAGISTVLVDYDLGAPDITNLFGIKGVPGIEVLAGRPVKQNILRDLIVQKDSLNILPGPMDKTLPSFERGQLLEIVDTLTEMYPVVVGDTPPEYWTKPWLAELFSRADYVLAVVDQSIFSEEDTKNYAPFLLSMGVTPKKIGIVLNRYSPKLHSPRHVERVFCSGFKKGVKKLPKVVAVIPEDWNAYVRKGYKGEVAGLDDVHSQWHRLAENIAEMAGLKYRQEKQKKGIKALFERLKKKK